MLGGVPIWSVSIVYKYINGSVQTSVCNLSEGKELVWKRRFIIFYSLSIWLYVVFCFLLRFFCFFSWLFSPNVSVCCILLNGCLFPPGHRFQKKFRFFLSLNDTDPKYQSSFYIHSSVHPNPSRISNLFSSSPISERQSVGTA